MRLDFFESEEAVDLPPEHALLAEDAVRLVERPGDRVVLAGKAADDKVVRGEMVVVAALHHLLTVATSSQRSLPPGPPTRGA